MERIGGAVAHAGRGRDAACGKDEHGDGGRAGHAAFAVGRAHALNGVCLLLDAAWEGGRASDGGGTSDG